MFLKLLARFKRRGFRVFICTDNRLSQRKKGAGGIAQAHIGAIWKCKPELFQAYRKSRAAQTLKKGWQTHGGILQKQMFRRQKERAALRGSVSALAPHLFWVLGYAAAATGLAVGLFLRQMKRQ